MRRILLLCLILGLAAPAVSAGGKRSTSARAEFRRANHCPATGRPSGPCPGYVVDHIQPLCAGGADAPHNMQWQTAEEGKIKDRAERALCRHR